MNRTIEVITLPVLMYCHYCDIVVALICGNTEHPRQPMEQGNAKYMALISRHIDHDQSAVAREAAET